MTIAEPGGGGIGRTLAYGVAVAVVVAGLTHLAGILILPYRSPDDAYARLARFAKGATMATVQGPLPLPDQDPALASAFCLFDLRHGPVQVGFDVSGADVALLSVYGRHGRVLYGLTNRSAAQNRLDLTILTADQAAAKPKTDEGAALGRVRVESDEPDGIVLAQALASAPSAMRQAQAQAARLSCTSESAPPAKSSISPAH